MPLAVLVICCGPLASAASGQGQTSPAGSAAIPTPELPVEPTAVVPAAPGPADRQIDALIQQMSVPDRIGQLFMIEFQGNDTSFDSDIAELIYGYRVGGVVLSPRNGNYSNEKGVDTPRQVAALINQLQALAYGVLLPSERAQALPDSQALLADDLVRLELEAGIAPPNLPLFIAVEQAGDNLPGTALRRGFTPLPSQLALGSTWQPELTRQAGEVIGRELAAVGVNMLLGPNLDVLDQVPQGEVSGLGSQSFGGNPFWVSQMARAYIAGVHAGSDNRVATVARHFPGQGNADRRPDEEVATIQRTAAELERLALPPFAGVTRAPSTVIAPGSGAGNAGGAGDAGATDALMPSHVRYSAFQGSTTGRTPPISIAPELGMLLEQAGFADWRTAGGLLVSGPLGTPAIRRYYDPALLEFPYRRVALDAFTAGNDLLYLGPLGGDDSWEATKANVKETIGFFQDKYMSDPDFAAQVDAALRRILRLKLGLYGGLAEDPLAQGSEEGAPAVPFAQVARDADDLAPLSEEARSQALVTMGQIAREATTLLFPDAAGLSATLPMPPQPGERLVIVTDSRLTQECDGCIAETAVAPDELAGIIQRLYGQEASGQVNPDQVVSLTFAELAEYLDAAGAAGSQEPAPMPAEQSASDTAPAPVEASAEVQVAAGEPDKFAKTAATLDQADWLIFAMLDVDASRYPASDVVKRLLREQGDRLTDQKIVVLALNAPYFLDATEIGKLDAYVGLYSKARPFLESAVRALFRAFTPTGAPAISAPGTRFSDLAARLQPDPARALELRVLAGEEEIAASAAGQAGEPAAVDAGSAIRIQVGPILDLNGRPVPDGTPVTFGLLYDDEDLARNIEPATTRAGVATRELILDRAGILRLSAAAGDAASAGPVTLNVRGPVDAVSPTAAPGTAEPAGVAADLPSPLPAAQGEATTAVTATAGQPVTATQDGGDAALPGGLAIERRVSPVTLAVALITILITLSLLLIVQVRVLPRRALVYNMLWAANFGLAGYILYGLGLWPGGYWLHLSLRLWASAVVVFIAMIFPLLWLQLRAE